MSASTKLPIELTSVLPGESIPFDVSHTSSEYLNSDDSSEDGYLELQINESIWNECSFSDGINSDDLCFDMSWPFSRELEIQSNIQQQPKLPSILNTTQKKRNSKKQQQPKLSRLPRLSIIPRLPLIPKKKNSCKPKKKVNANSNTLSRSQQIRGPREHPSDDFILNYIKQQFKDTDELLQSDREVFNAWKKLNIWSWNGEQKHRLKNLRRRALSRIYSEKYRKKWLNI